MKTFLKTKKFIYIYILIIASFFVLRIILFSNVYGAVEHDSGWYLGVAKNLALRGIYASYTNTVTEEGAGTFPSIHGRISVQDKNGYTYFPAGVSAGPGYTVPEAILLKIFGIGWWQYKLWPIIAFAGLLILLNYFVWKIGGFLSLVIFQIWLWATPHITMVFSFEAFSEHIAFFYLLLSIFFIYINIKKMHLLLIFFSGVALSLALLTKTVYIITIPFFLIFMFWELFIERRAIKLLIYKWLIFLFGLISPFAIFMLYRYLEIISKFGLDGWNGINQDFMIHFKSEGGSISSLLHPNWESITNRVNLWLNIGFKSLIWLPLLFSPLITFHLLKKKYFILYLTFFFICIISAFWFLTLEAFGWTRRAWQAFPLAIALLSIMLGLLIQTKIKLKFYKLILIGVIFLMILSIDLSRFELALIIPDKTLYWWNFGRYREGIQLLPHQVTHSSASQKQMITFFDKNIHKEDRVYYIGGLLVAELSPLVDKVFYPILRYEKLNYQNPDGGKSYLIFGPYQFPPFSIVSQENVLSNINKYCELIIFSNPSYMLCKMK